MAKLKIREAYAKGPFRPTTLLPTGVLCTPVKHHTNGSGEPPPFDNYHCLLPTPSTSKSNFVPSGTMHKGAPTTCNPGRGTGGCGGLRLHGFQRAQGALFPKRRRDGGCRGAKCWVGHLWSMGPTDRCASGLRGLKAVVLMVVGAPKAAGSKGGKGHAVEPRDRRRRAASLGGWVCTYSARSLLSRYRVVRKAARESRKAANGRNLASQI